MEAKALETGSASPDEWNSFPHNKGKRLQIIENIVKSRILFLEGNVESFSSLGIALHYIQDRWTLNPRTGSDYTTWELQENIANILGESKLEEAIRVLYLPPKTEKDYLVLLDKIMKGPDGLDDSEIPARGKHAFEGLCEKVTVFALLDRTSTLSHPFLDLNFAYRICLEVSRLVVMPVDEPIFQVSSQISMFENELICLRSKLRGFPESYLEKSQGVVRLEEIADVNEENMEQMNNIFEQRIAYGKGALDYAVFPSYGNKIEDLRERFRLTLKMEVREQRGNGFTNPYALPDFRIDFSSFEQAKYAEEAFFEILPKQKKEPVFSDRIGFIIEGLLNTKFPSDNELLTEILDAREKDLEKERALTNTINELKRTHEPSWNDVNNLRNKLSNIPIEYKLKLLTN